jgi:PleD family two-component response regulator
LSVETVVGFSFSAGVASELPSVEDSPRAWDVARRADQALYEAKASGKSRVIINPPPENLGA